MKPAPTVEPEAHLTAATEEPLMWKAVAIGSARVMSMLYGLEPMGPHVPNYGEISEAIATAATEDPLFPGREDGSELTAAILVALAWHESRFHPNAVGDNGRSFGLFQIQPPTSQTKAELLLLPRTASYIAIDLIRKSFIACQKRTWSEALSWYVASNGCPTHPVIVRKSMERMTTAKSVFLRFFPERGGALPDNREVPRALPPKREKDA